MLLQMSDKNEIQRKAAAMLTVLAESEECRQKICAHKEADSFKARLQTLSEVHSAEMMRPCYALNVAFD